MPRLPIPDIIVFDMDGTLIDVSRSYREAAPLAAKRYLELLGLRAPPLGGELFDLFKLMGGFNDDWDLTAGIIELIVAGLPPIAALPPDCSEQAESLIAALQASVAPFAGMTPGTPDWQLLAGRIRAHGGGLAGLRRVTKANNEHLVWHTGDAVKTDLVQRLFMESYLGEPLFPRCYGTPATYHRGPGLVEHDRLLISRTVLEKLSDRARLGIATGRTRCEAQIGLEMMQLEGYFGSVATMTQALEAQSASRSRVSLLKPNPYLLHLAADSLDSLREPRGTAAYVGDTPDDIVAARRADGARRWLSIALTTASRDPEIRRYYHDLGADLVLSHPDELIDALF